MTVKPTLGANKGVGAPVSSTEWNRDVLQEGNYTQEVLAGTNADKIPPTALNLTGTTSLETRNVTALGTVAGNTVEVERANGNDGGPNLNTLRAILRRAVAGADWNSSAWRLVQDIDNGTSQPGYVEVGPQGSTLRSATGPVTLDAAGKLLVLAVAGGLTLPGALAAAGAISTSAGGVTAPGDITSSAGAVTARKNGAPPGTGAGGIILGWNKSGGVAEGNIYSDRNTATPFTLSYWNGTAWVDVLSIGSGGQLTGPGVYDSGEFSVAASGNVSLNPGWNAPAKTVLGIYNGTSGVERYPMLISPQAISGVAAARIGLLPYDNIRNDIVVYNDSTITLYCRVWMMRA